MGVLSFFFSVSILLISFYSKDKYCILSALRSALLTATLELVWGVVVLIVVSHLESFSFASIASVSTRYIILLLLAAPAAPFVLLIFLLEAARIPFDLVEAESELVAGYFTWVSTFTSSLLLCSLQYFLLVYS